MTRLELRDLLVERVGWKADPNYTIDAINTSSLGGRYFQDEHSFIKIENIRHLMDKVDPDLTELNVYLSDLRKQVVLLVIDEALSGSTSNPIDFIGQENLFDAAISKRMAMKIGELAWTTDRSNRYERIAKQFFFDLNGDPNFPEKVSISGTYRKEIDTLKDIFNTEDALDAVTLRTVDYLDTDNIIRFE